jgi:hypothetical protein
VSTEPGQLQFAELVWKDLQSDAQRSRRHLGRPGLAAEIVLRAALIKQMNGFSYEELAFHVADSRTYLRFCGFTHPLQVPGKSALAQHQTHLRGDVGADQSACRAVRACQRC